MPALKENSRWKVDSGEKNTVEPLHLRADTRPDTRVDSRTDTRNDNRNTRNDNRNTRYDNRNTRTDSRMDSRTDTRYNNRNTRTDSRYNNRNTRTDTRVDTRYDNRNSRYERPLIKKEEVNMNNETLFPSLLNEENEIMQTQLKNDYLEKIKIQKKIDEDKNKNMLTPGWISYKREKGTHQTKVSRDGINYFDSLQETYTEEQWKEKERNELDESIQLFSYNMAQLHQQRKQESDDYYYETGELDTFAIVEIEQAEYEEYLKQFDEPEEENIEYEYTSDDYNSDGQ